MVRKIVAMALALSFAGILAVAPDAYAKRGRGADNPPEPPKCEVEDGGIVVCK